MKILIISNKMPFPPNDGGAIATLNMIQGFAQQGDKVHVITMQTYKHNFPVEKLPKNLTQTIEWYPVFIDTHIHPLKALRNLLFSNFPYNAERFLHPIFSEEIGQLLNSESFDVIQLEGLYLTPYIQLIRNHSNAIIALRAHNIEHEIWDRLAKNGASFLKRWYFKILARRIKNMEFEALKKIDLLIPITQKDADVFNFRNKENVFVSPGGIADDLFQKTEIFKTKSLCFLGALDWLPNQEGLLWFIKEVWVPLKQKFPEWDFEIAGRHAPSHFTDILKGFPVCFKGEVAKATEFIDPFAIVIVPLISGSGMRLKIVEAMTRGKCVVTTSVGAEGIHAVSGNDLYRADSATVMISVLENLFQNYELIHTCGQNAFKFATENYRNSQIIHELRNFYLKKITN